MILESATDVHTGFKVLSEAERTAALYSLLQHATQVQIRFFITVLQQMARADPMTALLSPAVGGQFFVRRVHLLGALLMLCVCVGSMQSQMEAKLASMSLKSPGLKSSLPSSPTARNFSANRLSLNPETTMSYLSPDTAAGGHDPAATLAQQRAKLKASNAAHRISAPALASQVGADRSSWGTGSNQLGQVDERAPSPGQEITIPSSHSAVRPKSTDFSGLANALKSPRFGGGTDGDLSPMVGESWANMVSTPLPMFERTNTAGQSLDAAAAKMTDWNPSGNGVPLIADPPKRLHRLSKGSAGLNGNDNGGMYGEDGSLQNGQSQQQQQQHQTTGSRRDHSNGNNMGGLRNASGAGNGWSGARSPALSNTSSGRFGGGGDDGSMAAAAAAAAANLNGLGMGGGFGMGGMGSPGLSMMPGSQLNMAALAAAGAMPMTPFQNMFSMQNMQSLAAMGISPEVLAMQMAAAASAGGLGQAGAFAAAAAAGMYGQGSPGMRGGRGGGSNGGGLGNGRSPGMKAGSARSGGSGGGGGDGGKKDEEDVDPKLLEDIPAWLRSLRLHKYTPNFEGMHWREVVMMDEGALEAKGVAALGARRKMIKTFEIVRRKMGMEGPAVSVVVAV